jgi:hypothetical protein
MSSIRRIQASRANGARSNGPITPEGKQRSAANATTHGLLSQTLVLADEDSDLFEVMLQGFVDRFQPVDNVEFSLVENAAAAIWRQRRCWGLEKSLVDQASRATQGDPDPVAPIATGYASLALSPGLPLIHRYEARLERIFHRTLATLERLRDSRNTNLPNEPNPTSEHGHPLSESSVASEEPPDRAGETPPDETGRDRPAPSPEEPVGAITPSVHGNGRDDWFKGPIVQMDSAESAEFPNEPNPVSEHSPPLPAGPDNSDHSPDPPEAAAGSSASSRRTYYTGSDTPETDPRRAFRLISRFYPGEARQRLDWAATVLTDSECAAFVDKVGPLIRELKST